MRSKCLPPVCVGRPPLPATVLCSMAKGTDGKELAFAFKCHRPGKEIFPVNTIKYHPSTDPRIQHILVGASVLCPSLPPPSVSTRVRPPPVCRIACGCACCAGYWRIRWRVCVLGQRVEAACGGVRSGQDLQVRCWAFMCKILMCTWDFAACFTLDDN